MNKRVLISGASIAGLTLAYWLHRFGFQVTVVEMAKGLRRGGSPIDVRGAALDIAKQMGIREQIKSREFVHTDELVNAQNETLVRFSINAQAEYAGDIEIHRDDLVDILYANIPATAVEFLFDNRIAQIDSGPEQVTVTFRNQDRRNFDFVFGADGTHSGVRRLIFGAEEQYTQFFGAYFALTEAPHLQIGNASSGGVLYHEPGMLAALYPFKQMVHAMLAFRSPQLNWDYRNRAQAKQILKDRFKKPSWRIPEILAAMLCNDHLYFDAVSQIHMPSWSKGRIALLGDAAYTSSFPTGMGTSLAMEGAAILAKTLQSSEGNYTAAFSAYYDTFHPVVKEVQARIIRGLNWSLPETEEAIQQAIARFS